MLDDLKHAVRMLLKSPGFAVVAVLTLALGIGANTAIFSLVDAVLLRSLPVQEPDELVLLDWGAKPTAIADPNSRWNNGLWGDGAFSMLSFDRMREGNHTLAALFGFRGEPELNVVVGGEAEVIEHGQYVTGNYCEALGARPLLGRMIMPGDDQAGAPPVVVLSHRFWQRRFGGAPDAVGKSIVVNKVACVVVGVAPPGFSGTLEVGEAPDVMLPLVLIADARQLLNRPQNRWWLRIMGRLKPGVELAEAQADLAGLFRESVAAGIAGMPRDPRDTTSAMPEESYLPRLKVEPGGQGLMTARGGYKRSLMVLTGLVGLVLLIACANVANLLLARGAGRRKEIAVRLALGAGRWRVMRQLLMESVLLAALGGGLGILFASWGRILLLAMHPLGWDGPGFLELNLDLRVLGFTLAIAACTTLLFGLAPALSATGLNIAAVFRGAARGAGGDSRSVLQLARALMIVQVALSAMLLVGAGLFVRTLHNLHREDIGFDRSNLLLFRIDATPVGYQPGPFVALRERLVEKMEAAPGVLSVTMSTFPVLSRTMNHRPFWVPGNPLPRQDEWPLVNAVDAKFFDTFGIPFVLGRAFNPVDGEGAPPVAIINQTLAREYFGAENPVGRRFSMNPGDGDPNIEVAGVVRDAKYADVKDPVPPTIYLPFVNEHLSRLNVNWAQMNFAVRTSGDPHATLASLREAVREIDHALPLTDVRTMDEQVERLFAQERLFSQLASGFGLLAVALACVGLYGLMSCAVLRRTGEIGVRMALGALPGQVLRMILVEALALAALGALAGIGGAWAAGKLVARMLYGLSPSDPLTYVSVAGVLLGVASLAALIPARRAARVDPMVALRTDG